MASDAHNKITHSSVHGVVVQGRDIGQINVVSTDVTTSTETEIWKHRYKACVDLFHDWQVLHESLQRYFHEWGNGHPPKEVEFLPGQLEALRGHSATLQVLGLHRFDFTLMFGWAEGILELIDAASQAREFCGIDKEYFEQASENFRTIEGVMHTMEMHIRRALGT
ncbi:hypothetical protein ACIQU6_34080 [Streptomyces sp. NPDC090442]|uniref:hypothetical protein n=1 Tax=Streptomyces sp. NPDC090442 TaxID=3365962 RepID=UPI0037F92A19